MIFIILMAVFLTGQDEMPPTNSFQTILRSTGVLQHRPVFTAMDVTTRSFRINIQVFSSRLEDVLIRLKRIQLSKLTVEYRPIAMHYTRAIQEKASLLQSTIHNGIFFVMKKFWEQVRIPNPLPKMDLNQLIPQKSVQKYQQSGYNFDVNYINSYQNINTSILAYVRGLFDAGQFESMNDKLKRNVA